ncbi:MAG: RNA polymerase sigma factor [Elusimicrobiota bacterium]
MDQAGCERYEQFVRSHGERAFRFAYRLAGDAEEAKEVVQDAFFRLFRTWECYDPSQPLEAWFTVILRNVFLDGRRRYERRHTVPLDEGPRDGEEEGRTRALGDGEPPLLEVLEREEVSARVRAALERLEYDHRTVLTLCDMEGCSYEEISRVVDVPVGTVRSRLSRAREALRRELLSEEGVTA